MNKNFIFDLQRFDDISLTQKDGAYLISSVEDLNILSAYVNAGNDCDGKTFKQTKNIEFATVAEGESNFTAIGDNFKPFNGTFDGNGKTISNVKISGGDY